MSGIPIVTSENNPLLCPHSCTSIKSPIICVVRFTQRLQWKAAPQWWVIIYAARWNNPEKVTPPPGWSASSDKSNYFYKQLLFAQLELVELSNVNVSSNKHFLHWSFNYFNNAPLWTFCSTCVTLLICNVILYVVDGDFHFFCMCFEWRQS